MNRKVLGLLIAAVMILAVVPVNFAFASQVSPTKSSARYAPRMPANVVDDIIPFEKHRTGTILAPLEQYENLVGFDVHPMTSSAFETAMANAPFNPLSAIIFLPNGTSGVPSNLPSKILNNLYLPPVGDQGYVGSCNAWSSTYYVWTYMMNWWRNNPHPRSASDIMNPTFTYNLINGGEDAGSLPWDAMNLISTIGAVPLNAFPLYTYPPFPDDYAWVWPNLTQWLMAPHNSGTEDMYIWQYFEPGFSYLYELPGQWYYINFTNDTQWKYAKALLAKGYVFQTTINVLPSFEFLGHPEDFIGYLNFYAYYANNFSKEYWTNGSYASWTVEDLLDEALKEYNVWAAEEYGDNSDILQELVEEGKLSRNLLENVLTNKLGINLNDPVYVVASQLEDSINRSFINNESWWNNATFYLSAYSINGEKWFVNNGFDVLYTISNFEWMIHYIPLNEYLSRAPYFNFGIYYNAWQGGHAVTVVGYNDTLQTPDGNGALVMVNSWGTNWGYNGYWYLSYDAAKSAGTYYDTTVDGIFPVEFQIEWPVTWGGSSGFVYVPKASDYTSPLMAIVGIKHPVRGEVIDGIYGDTQYIPAGIPVGVRVGNDTWSHSYLDFWNDYLWGDITNETTAADLPQDHPFPNSPMAFDISQAIQNVTFYLLETNATPLYATFFVAPHDILKDNITGEIYNFTILIQTPKGLYPIAAHVGNVTIPDGSYTIVPVTVPIVQYGYLTPEDNSIVSFGNFNVDIVSMVPLQGAYVSIDGKKYQLSEENGGYYFYGTGIDYKLKLPAGTYNYTVVVVYPNGKDVALPTRTITIREPVVYIQSPKPIVYNVSTIKLSAKVVDAQNITNVTVSVGNRIIPLLYNSTAGLYEGTINNLTDGYYTLIVTAKDIANNTGSAKVSFVVHTGAKVTKVTVNNETNVTIGVVGGSVNVTAENSTIVANVSTSSGNFTVEIPVVNNVSAVVVNASAIDTVVSGGSNATLVAGWNANLTQVSTKSTPVETKGNKKIYSVTITANVSIGENGVAVVALRDVNISKIYLMKNGQKVQLTTNRSNTLGYYYKQDSVIFVVLKEDPTIVAEGTKEVTIPQSKKESEGISLATFNFLGYRWYNLYHEKFNETYQEAVQLGVDNKTLQKALELNNEAEKYYSEALKVAGGNIILHLGDVRLLVPLRKAYLTEMKAVELLNEAIKELQSKG